MSLRFRLIIAISFGLLASLAFGGAIALWAAARQVQTEMRSGIAVAEQIAQAAVGEFNHGANGRELLERLIREFDGNRHLQASLMDRNHQIVLTSKLEPPNTRVPEWFRRLLDRGPDIARINLPSEFDEYEAVVLTTDAANELAEKWGDIGLALAVLVIFCTFVLGLVYWILARGLLPLQALNVAFVRVGRGDYSPRVTECGATELARLAREFNQMVTRLSTMQLQNARLNEQLANVQEEERAELARELHDEIGPFLFAVSLDISAMHQTISKSADISSELASRVEAIRTAIAHMQKHLKIILGRLRPTVLFDLGLAQAMDNLIDFWRERHPDVVFDLKVIPESFGDRLDQGIYRIVRESLSNALRHGRPSEIAISVRLADNDTIAIEVVDDGGGMKPSNAAVGFGITGMQERAAMLGGTISVQNRSDGKGVVVSVRLPFQKPPEFTEREAEGSVAA
ncbi:MAG: HAMP domain-containing protein [Bradyrhizobiaceae bacterium]|nr:HAMP domain-containing protein [Bradyrhizobiaceae bacterium]